MIFDLINDSSGDRKRHQILIAQGSGDSSLTEKGCHDDTWAR